MYPNHIKKENKFKKMGKQHGYLVVSEKDGIKYYYLPSIDLWTDDFGKIGLSDINESKIDVDMSKFPDLEDEYTHEAIEINGNFYE